jgi:hypothetical protein
MINTMNAAAAAAPEEEEEDWDALLEQQLHSLSDAAYDTDEDVTASDAEQSVESDAQHDLPAAAPLAAAPLAAELELKAAWSQLMASAKGVQQYWTSAEAVAAEVATLPVPPLRARIAASDEPGVQPDELTPAADAVVDGSTQVPPAEPDQLASAASEAFTLEEIISEDASHIEQVPRGDTDATAAGSSLSRSQPACHSAAREVEASTVKLRNEPKQSLVLQNNVTADNDVYQDAVATAGADDMISHLNTAHTAAVGGSTVNTDAVVHPTPLPLLPVSAPLAAVAAADDEAVVLERLQRASEIAAAERQQRRDSLRAEVSQTTAILHDIYAYVSHQCSSLRCLLHPCCIHHYYLLAAAASSDTYIVTNAYMTS